MTLTLSISSSLWTPLILWGDLITNLQSEVLKTLINILRHPPVNCKLLLVIYRRLSAFTIMGKISISLELILI